jgi:surface polysaccharide O-acyltransferase-like enzyme
MDRRFDLLRILACFLVVVIHVSGADVLACGQNWWAGNIYDSFARPSVPTFFMISGAMLLPKSEPLLLFFRKRLLKVIPPLVGWSGFYLWWLWFNGAHIGGPRQWIASIVRGPTMYHLWFFYAILGLYLFVPVMRRAYQASGQTEKWLLVALWFLWICLYPALHAVLAGTGFIGVSDDPHAIGYFAPYAGYMFLGAVLAEREWRKSTGAALFAIGVICTAGFTAISTLRAGALVETFYLYLAPNVAVAAAGLFMLFSGLRKGPSTRLQSNLSAYTVAIYGMHVFLVDPVAERLGLPRATGVAWIDVPLTAGCVFVVAAAIAHIWRLGKDTAKWLMKRFGPRPY